jgi:hypothetical protein
MNRVARLLSAGQELSNAAVDRSTANDDRQQPRTALHRCPGEASSSVSRHRQAKGAP